ncbi:hypothetical protein ACHAWO_005777 [Cyclotella atomus]|uniref:Cation/H+ exchanger domain-containing protein n=1 Tax=Cyclotella atomus TaxID=382360 RepID=A0ABD3NGB4_9STRA
MASATTTTTTTATMARERGTLKHTLPRRPIIIIAIVGIFSALLAAQLTVYSSSANEDAVARNWWMYFGISCLGSMEVLVGIVLGDSRPQLVVFVMIILLGGGPAGLGDARSAIQAAAPSYIFLVLTLSKSTRPIIDAVATCIQHIPLVILQSMLLLLSTSFVLQYNTQAKSSSFAESFSLLPIFTITSITLTLLHAYNQNKSHKHGNLLSSSTNVLSQSIIGAACHTISSILLYQMYPMYATSIALGELFAILTTAFFASISDVWYSVGSGQFQMVSLDSAGLILYFIVPATMLYLRFLDQYGERVGGVMNGWVGGLMDGLGMELDGANDTLVFILSVTTAIGVPIINALCPMGGYLFARAYTHGQPNTKKVAICINCSDLLSDVSTLQSMLEQRKAVLNIYVTLNDMQSHSQVLIELAKQGHYIALAPSANIEAAFNEYNNLFGEAAGWAFSNSYAAGRHPTYLRKAHDLGMKVAYWSTLVRIEGATLSEEQRNYFVSDVADKNGGSIIYISCGKGASKDSSSNALSTIVELIKDFSIAPLSQVVKDDSTMRL